MWFVELWWRFGGVLMVVWGVLVEVWGGYGCSGVGMTNRSNQVDFAKSTFYFEISL